MDKMTEQMFKGFGSSMMMRDPFKDDPFFNGKGGMGMLGGFDGMDKMIKEMRSGMHDHGSMMGGGKGGHS